MSLFNLTEPVVDAHTQRAIGVLKFGEQSAEEIVRLWRMQWEMVWAIEGYTIADAQAVLDAMGTNALVAFAKHAALGAFISQHYPGQLTETELSSPVPYTLVEGRIVLDPNATYPGPRAAA